MTTSSDKIQSLLSSYPEQERYLIHSGHGLYGLPAESIPAEHTLLLSVDEAHKSLETVAQIWDFLYDTGATRHSLIIAVGGGVLTDIVGFAAATYMRGVNWLSVPTTLLSMVDAGTGGKTGCNYHGIKNGIGAFHRPLEVYLDTRYLHTLPGEQILSGYAEMVKHELLRETEDRKLILPDPENLTTDDIVRSIAIKERIVTLDPKEQGLRKALNLGHTVGHALESLSLTHAKEGNPPLLHGYAVIYGLAAELYLSHVLLGLKKEVVSAIAHLITEYYGRPSLSCKQYPELLERMRHDKKGPMNFTLLRHVGDPVVNQTIEEPLILEALDYLFTL